MLPQGSICSASLADSPASLQHMECPWLAASMLNMALLNFQTASVAFYLICPVPTCHKLALVVDAS